MKLHERNIFYYLRRFEQGIPFSFAGYSDAEWFCMAGKRAGELTGLGQVMDPVHGERLWDVLRRRQGDPRFLVAIPKLLFQITGFDQGEPDWLLGRRDVRIEAYERDMVTDDLAAAAGLFPLVDAVRKSGSGVLIGNHALERMQRLLNLRQFVGIDGPNLHMQPGGIQDAVERAKRKAKPGIYLVSAGVSAAVIIDQLHDVLPDSYFFDCGSMWDAFVGIGGQRAWRAELYAVPKAWKYWVRKCLHGR